MPAWTFCLNTPHHQLDLQYSFMFSGVLQHWHVFYEVLPAGVKGVVCNLYWGIVSFWSVLPFSAVSVHLQRGEAGVPQFAEAFLPFQVVSACRCLSKRCTCCILCSRPPCIYSHFIEKKWQISIWKGTGGRICSWWLEVLILPSTRFSYTKEMQS